MAHLSKAQGIRYKSTMSDNHLIKVTVDDQSSKYIIIANKDLNRNKNRKVLIY